MQRSLSILFGLALVGFGVLCMAGNFLASFMGSPLFWWEFWRFWPLVVVAVGLFLVAVPILGFRQRALGVFFIPGMPILTTGSILLVNSLFGWWDAWALLWPLEVISLAIGFLLAAFFTRLIWLGIPAILIGVNGLVLAFCNLTGLWHWWSVLWTVEPLAVGLCLLLIAIATRSVVVAIIGGLFCGFAATAFLGMSTLFAFNGWFIQIAAPASIILVGIVLLIASLMPRRPAIQA